jgi:hypothetical protein
MKTAKDYQKGETIKDWIEDGIRCLLKRGPAAFCGYVGIPKDHPLAGFGYDDLPLNCHGGLTFAKLGEGKFFPEGWYFYGWDYAHLGDKCTYDLEISIDHNDKDWTDEEVEREIKSVLWDFNKLVRLAEKIANKPKA